MPGPRSPRQIELAPDARVALVHPARSPSVEAGLARRARIVLLAADGVPVRHIGPRVGAALTDPADRPPAGRLMGQAPPTGCT
jgi:hypothetical protein